MTSTISVSIIIPVYNVEKYISRCINSVINQTYKNWELLLINDGSTDDSGLICDKYANKDSRIKVYHIQNSGAAKARFLGVSYATKDYICFVDSDDSIPNNSLELLCENNQDCSIDIVVGGYTRIFVNGKTDFCELKYANLTGEVYLLMLLSGNWKLYGPVAKLFRRTLFTNNILPFIPKTIRVGEDLLMNVFLACYAKKVVFISSSVYNYFQIETSVTHNFKYTLEYTEKFVNILTSILLESKKENINHLLAHYKLNMIYNVILDDIEDEINYQSDFVLTIINDANKISLNYKEKIIIKLLKYSFFRICYRKLFCKYRNGSGFVYLFIKHIKCFFI